MTKKIDRWNADLIALAERFSGNGPIDWPALTATREWKRLLLAGQKAARAQRAKRGLFDLETIRTGVWFIEHHPLTEDQRGKLLHQVLLSIESRTKMDLAVSFEVGRMVGMGDALRLDVPAHHGVISRDTEGETVEP